jgi:hypothetical protein
LAITWRRRGLDIVIGLVGEEVALNVDIAAKQKGSSPTGQVSTRDAVLSAPVVPKSASVAAAVPFESVQQLKTMAQDLNVVRQKLEHLNAAQQQMAQKIASLQALQQEAEGVTPTFIPSCPRPFAQK